MKKPILFFILSCLFLIANSGGPGATTGRDRTGGPLASGDCSNCHIGGNYGAEVEAQLLLDQQEVQEYIPGQSYTFKVKVKTSTPAERYGFQAVALIDQNNLNAGTFGMPPQGTQITMLNNRAYFEHATKLQVDSFEIEWKAPEAGTGDVQFFAAGNAVNNANGSGGDDPDVLDQPLTVSESVASNLNTVRKLNIDWEIFPNPTQKQVWIRIDELEKSDLQVRLLDQKGTVLQQSRIKPFADQISFSLNHLTSGQYYIQLSNDKGIATRSLIKQ